MNLTLRVAALAAALTATAMAQPTPRDHREDHKDDHRDHRDRVPEMSPVSGPVGTTITIHDAPAGANLVIGKHRVNATAVGERAATAIVPELPPGRHGVEAEVAGKIIPIGTFEVTAAAAPPPPPEHEGEEHHHHEWKLDRPVVSSYWPTKGKAGSRVVIRGRNFPADAMVVWGDAQITGAKVTPDEIVFNVPGGAASGAIALRTGHGHDVAVGAFEVAAFDADAEWRRTEDERRHSAEQGWAEREKQLAKDRAARDAAFKHEEEERTSSRAKRREQRLAELRAKWKREFLADPETESELTLHAQRIADIDRMKALAEQLDNGKLAVRIEVARTRETERHDQRMAALQAAFNGGHP